MAGLEEVLHGSFARADHWPLAVLMRPGKPASMIAPLESETPSGNFRTFSTRTFPQRGFPKRVALFAQRRSHLSTCDRTSAGSGCHLFWTSPKSASPIGAVTSSVTAEHKASRLLTGELPRVVTGDEIPFRYAGKL